VTDYDLFFENIYEKKKKPRKTRPSIHLALLSKAGHVTMSFVRVEEVN